jgi:hypothetical protein
MIMQIPTTQEIFHIVVDSMKTGTPPDPTLTALLYPKGAPSTWGGWSPEARSAWATMVAMYMDLRPVVERGQDREEPPLVGEVWDALEASLAQDSVEDRLAWQDLCQRLGFRNRRRAQYVLETRLGFVLKGHQTQKYIEFAPCAECGLGFTPPQGTAHRTCQGCSPQSAAA